MDYHIDIMKIYNLLDPNGNKLQLFLGRKVDNGGDAVINGKDKGWRWSFYGTKIPMPIRKGEWFNGFPEETMLNWLKAHGWHVRTIVHNDAKATVFDLPEAPDAPEAEIPATETDWIPVSSGRYPEENEIVQVTYMDWLVPGNPLCNLMAYRNENRWFWAEAGDPIYSEITAWRPVGTPYKGDATAKATEVHI